MDDIRTGRTITSMQAWKFCHGIRCAQPYASAASGGFSPDFGRLKSGRKGLGFGPRENLSKVF